MSLNLIETNSLTKIYRHQTVVDSVNLHIPAGSVYGFLGPNGAGKSTTMKMILGLIKASSGQIYTNFPSITGRSPIPKGRLIGSMIEGPAFYANLTAKENLELVCDYLSLPYQQGYEALDLVGLLKTTGDKPAKTFSLGMKQRLGLAMALAPQPPLLVLDEPTNGLDPSGVVEIRNLILEWSKARGATVMISSHVLSEIEQMADYVGIISGGKIRFEGPLSNLQDKGFLRLQTNNNQAAAQLLSNMGIVTEPLPVGLNLGRISKKSLAEIVKTMVINNIEVYRLEAVQRSLEQAFLKLTDPIYVASSTISETESTSGR